MPIYTHTGVSTVKVKTLKFYLQCDLEWAGDLFEDRRSLLDRASFQTIEVLVEIEQLDQQFSKLNQATNIYYLKLYLYNSTKPLTYTI